MRANRAPDDRAGEWPQVTAPVALSLGNTPLAKGWSANAQLLPATPDLLARAQTNPDVWTAYLTISDFGFRISDFGFEISDLSLRPRVPGDRIQPLGMSGSIKLSDLMINRKIPMAARAGWPLLVAGNEVLWAAGLCLNHRYRVTGETKRVLIVRLERSREWPMVESPHD